MLRVGRLLVLGYMRSLRLSWGALCILLNVVVRGRVVYD